MLNKAKPILREQKFREFISETASLFVSTVYDNFEGVRSDDVEAIHDMRVATRRLRETLQLFTEFYPPSRSKKILTKIRKVTRILGLPREMDVNAGLLHAYEPNGGLVLQTTREHLLLWCEDERSRLKRRMLRRFEKFDLGSFESDLRLFVQSVLPPRSRMHHLFEEHQAAELETFRRRIPALLLAKARPILDFRITESATKDDDELHQLRIATKKLRYALEILRPVQASETGDAPVEQCRTLQDILGDLHDRVVLLDLLKEHQIHLTDQGLLLLTHGCSRISTEFLDAKEALLSKIKPAHEELVASLLSYFRRLESVSSTSLASPVAPGLD
jgi:CHAD domain-containing protein